jgi:hypothetical protein
MVYAGLKHLTGEKRAKLDEALQIFKFRREVDNLEQWIISNHGIVVGIQELGTIFDDVTVS